ncbi:MAG: DNA/RNA non-specific endonuclease [Rikenellaceae bacterium]
MRRLYLIIFSCLILCNTLSAQNYLPRSSGELVEHTYFTLSYIEEHEQAEWVYYTLSPATLTGQASRSDNFRSDGKVSTKSATTDDYKSSGYDRGHLCPAASMSRNDTAMSESFLMSNMSPQIPAFNRGAWKSLEERVRELALRDSVLHVVTGSILSESLGSIGENRVTVPKYYYKVLYSPKKGAMIAFIMENCKLDDSLDSYATSVDRLEQLSGIDFFAQLNDELQTEESKVDLSLWVVQGDPIFVNSSDESVSDSVATKQCQAITSSGAQCKRTAQSGSDYCWQHQK